MNAVLDCMVRPVGIERGFHVPRSVTYQLTRHVGQYEVIMTCSLDYKRRVLLLGLLYYICALVEHRFKSTKSITKLSSIEYLELICRVDLIQVEPKSRLSSIFGGQMEDHSSSKIIHSFRKVSLKNVFF